MTAAMLAAEERNQIISQLRALLQIVERNNIPTNDEGVRLIKNAIETGDIDDLQKVFNWIESLSK